MNPRIYKTPDSRQIIMQRYQEIIDAWPVKNEQYRINTKHGETFIIESGSKKSPPLILLHGSTSNSFCWIGDIEKWSQHFNVYAIDIIGEAGYSADNRPSYTSGAYPEWLNSVLHELGLEQVSMVGLSLGGWMGLSFATKYPERVTQLALLCPGGIIKEKPSFLFKAVGYSLLGKWGNNQIMKMLNGGQNIETSSEGLSKAIAFTSLISKHFNPRMEPLTIFSDDELTKLTMPTLLVFGDRDCMLHAKASINRFKVFASQAETVLLPNTGHIITSQTERILNFMKKSC